MKKENPSILQLGKFYPIKGGVEKVAYDLMTGLSTNKIHCDMLCATVAGKGKTIRLNSYARLMECVGKGCCYHDSSFHDYGASESLSVLRHCTCASSRPDGGFGIGSFRI